MPQQQATMISSATHNCTSNSHCLSWTHFICQQSWYFTEKLHTDLAIDNLLFVFFTLERSSLSRFTWLIQWFSPPMITMPGKQSLTPWHTRLFSLLLLCKHNSIPPHVPILQCTHGCSCNMTSVSSTQHVTSSIMIFPWSTGFGISCSWATKPESAILPGLPMCCLLPRQNFGLPPAHEFNDSWIST